MSNQYHQPPFPGGGYAPYLPNNGEFSGYGFPQGHGGQPAYQQPGYNQLAASRPSPYSTPQQNHYQFQANAKPPLSTQNGHHSMTYSYPPFSNQYIPQYPRANVAPASFPPNLSQQFNSPTAQVQPGSHTFAPVASSIYSRGGNPSFQQTPQTSPLQVPQIAQVSAREEGELSDGELDESQTAPIEDTGQNHSSQDSNQAPPSQTSHSGQVEQFQAQSSNMGNVLGRFGGREEGETIQDNSNGMDSYSPPQAPTPQSQQQPPHSFSKIPDVPDHEKPGQVEKSVVEIKKMYEQAKLALQKMLELKIGFSDLVREAVDPEVLKGLYHEIEASAKSKASSPPPLLPRTDSKKDVRHANAPQVRKEVHEDTPLPNAQISKPHSTSKSPELERRTGATVKSTSSATFQGAKSVSASEEKAKMAMERKDRIAQLIAAEAGKPLPSKAEASSSHQMNKPPPPLPPPIPVSVRSANAEQTLDTPPPQTSAHSTARDLTRPRNHAQTELVRRKMAALKREAEEREALQKAQSLSQAPFGSKSSSPRSDAHIMPPQEPLARSASPFDNLGYQIPGLFMAHDSQSSPASATLQTQRNDRASKDGRDQYLQSLTTTSFNRQQCSNFSHPLQSPSRGMLPQKRPVASDFFGNEAPAKRPVPFTQSNDQVQIIMIDSASEGEIDDVAMEIDEGSEGEIREEDGQTSEGDASEGKKTEGPIHKPLAEVTASSIRQPPISSTNADSSPIASASQTPSKQGKITDLQSWHREIDLMHKRIAAAEERRRQKNKEDKVQSPFLKDSSKAPPPVIRTAFARPSAPSIEASRDFSAPVSRISGSVPRSPDLVASRPSDLPLTPTTPLSALKEPARADNLRTNLLRRQSTREGTPGALEIERLKALLAEKHAQMAKARLEAEKIEAQMREEARLLESQLQAGLIDEQLDGEEKASTELTVAINESQEEKIVPTSEFDNHSEKPDKDLEIIHGPDTESLSTNVEKIAISVPASPKPSKPVATVSQPDYSLENAPGHEGGVTRSPSHMNFVSRFTDRSTSGSEVGKQGSGKVLDVVVDSQHVEKPFLTQQSSFLDNEQVTQSPFTDGLEDTQPVGEGSISMAESPSDVYDPAEDVVMDESQGATGASDGDEGEIYEPQDLASVAQRSDFYPDETNGMNEDDYEPPEEGELQDDEEYEPASAVTTQRQPEENLFARSGALHSPSPASSDATHTMKVTEHERRDVNESMSDHGMQTGQKDYVDGLQVSASLPVPTSADTEAPPSNGTSLTGPNVQSGSHFTPYLTPRRFFRNYRYHDSFDEAVKGGHKSFTYSNKIDSKVSFCLNELIDGDCLDPRCSLQHFSQVGMSDDEVLSILSSTGTLEGAELERWRIGFATVVNDLSQKPSRDFATLASALAAYRRRFAQELSITPSTSLPAAL